MTTVYADYETISAGLLHDVLEDCDCTAEEMEEKFGPSITKLVKGVTKLSNIKFIDKVCIIIGNEGRGMSKELIKYCNDLIYIPMNNLCESLNAGVSASIIMYEVSKVSYEK